ncbi:MAG: hypothetical protein GAK40_01310 [Burkholderia plantarii]|nr:MAG: hypothetical protein GAK40_01310 [Burkholderia plantarii]
MKQRTAIPSGLPLRSMRASIGTRAAIALASTLCFASVAQAAPGAPSLQGWNITSKPHGFVEIDVMSAGA